MRYHAPLLLMALLLLSSCSRHRESGSELALSALTNHFSGVSLDDFEQARIYNDKKYDIVIYYVTKSSVVPKRELILYIKDGRIIERHSMAEDDDE